MTAPASSVQPTPAVGVRRRRRLPRGRPHPARREHAARCSTTTCGTSPTVVGLPNQLAPTSRRFDFTAITDPRWRLVAKELILAMLAPRHEAVAPLPRAYRTPLHLDTAYGRLAELARWLRWLTARGVASLAEVDDGCCEAYLAHRRYVRDGDGAVVGERSPATRRAAAQTVADLINYRELFTADRVAADLRPWGGAAPSAVAEMPCGRGQNKTPPVAERRAAADDGRR